MILKSDLFIEPDDKQVKIWRYMDFLKFMDLVENQMLFFTKAIFFEDKFEGSFPLGSMENYIKARIDFREELQSWDWKEVREQHSAGRFESQDRHFKLIEKDIRKNTLVNCWHMSDVESAAMWKIYTNNNQGVAIQTTYQKLVDVLSPSEVAVSVGSVRYINYLSDKIENWDNPMSRIMLKRASFEHEKELRVVISIPQKSKNTRLKSKDAGLNLSINISELIENIYVSPASPQWVLLLVKKMLVTYKLSHIPVFKSGLDRGPIFLK